MQETCNNNKPKPTKDVKMRVKKVESFSEFKDIVAVENKVLIKFEADWCMPCKAMASVVEEVAKQHPDVRFIAVDIESEGMDELLLEFEVRSLPTFVHLEEGNKTDSVCGTISKTELSSFVGGN